MKLACVVQRYGAGVAGGSERHCRELALRLAARHDVTVLTTCAADHVTWRNEFPTGESLDDGVRVRRFPVARERALSRYGEITERVFDAAAGDRGAEAVDHARDFQRRFSSRRSRAFSIASSSMQAASSRLTRCWRRKLSRL